ncbi:hypothetical protein BJ875DRAFT_175182 [Amylocarpus encephaloides]|uniref:Uncharacterized protein n=1 Tax=Amylocarpus encephaloides TaxID=45428 RepID=A0A9P7YNZ2_9HELO|nr:hypothetical protein BJ875DRAFT_175182 [Amylocarpus encephaloides]
MCCTSSTRGRSTAEPNHQRSRLQPIVQYEMNVKLMSYHLIFGRVSTNRLVRITLYARHWSNTIASFHVYSPLYVVRGIIRKQCKKCLDESRGPRPSPSLPPSSMNQHALEPDPYGHGKPQDIGDMTRHDARVRTVCTVPPPPQAAIQRARDACREKYNLPDEMNAPRPRWRCDVLGRGFPSISQPPSSYGQPAVRAW